MDILYIGESKTHSTSYHRATALQRLGHTVAIVNPREAVPPAHQRGLLGAIHYRTGYRLLQKTMLAWLDSVLPQRPDRTGTPERQPDRPRPDLVWVDSGELLGPACVRRLAAVGCPVVLYNVDDPTGGRDGQRFGSLKKALPFYDLVVVVREETEAECRALGAKQVLRVLRSYDEVAHRPFDDPADIPAEYRTDVAFTGTWMRHEKRDEFLLYLIEQGINVSIRGERWQKSPYWKQLEPYYRGGPLAGRDYVAAMQGAKLCLGLLSKGNRDRHTTRSLETPYAGGLLCAERTTDHTDFYREGEEAVFWSDAAECALVCQRLLGNDLRREAIRQAGMRRVRAMHVGNEDACRTILSQVFIPQPTNVPV